MLKPLTLACETKSVRLQSGALSAAHKLAANGALSPEGAAAAVAMLGRTERSGDESVQLKTLQLALTLLQSAGHPTSEGDLAAVLGVCFRTLTHKGHKATVVSTAAATVRQAVALVFSYIDVDAEAARLAAGGAAAVGAASTAAAAAAAGDAAAAGGASPAEGGEAAGAEGAEAATPPQPAVVAAQRLIEDLCAIAMGALRCCRGRRGAGRVRSSQGCRPAAARRQAVGAQLVPRDS